MIKFKMKTTYFVMLGITLAINLCEATDQTATNFVTILDGKATADASEQLKALRGQIDNVDAVYAAYGKANEKDQSEKLWQAYVQTNDSVIPKILKEVRRAPTTPVSFELLNWVVTNVRISTRTLRPNKDQALEILRNYHFTNSNIESVCKEIGFYGDTSDKNAIEFLQLAWTNNANRSARGFAAFALARLTKQKAASLAYWENAPASILTNTASQNAKAAYEEDARQGDSQIISRKAEQLFETVIKDYGDCPNFHAGPGLRQPKPTLGEQARIELFDCQHLTVGKIAPDISGEDIQGHELRLSAFRGKIVMLSFWASWCGPCMQMVPHERTMVQRLKGRPFVLVGVNGDGVQADAKRAVEKENMTWPSFWNGKDGAEGQIPTTWNVHSWPTVFILDAKGTIRLKAEGYGGKRSDSVLDEAVDQLLSEIKD